MEILKKHQSNSKFVIISVLKLYFPVHLALLWKILVRKMCLDFPFLVRSALVIKCIFTGVNVYMFFNLSCCTIYDCWFDDNIFEMMLTSAQCNAFVWYKFPNSINMFMLQHSKYSSRSAHIGITNGDSFLSLSIYRGVNDVKRFSRSLFDLCAMKEYMFWNFKRSWQKHRAIY